MGKGILDGVRVMDFTWVLAGPYATRLLADFGAEVIKIQSSRTAKGAESNLTGYFNMWNRNKLSVTLDMDRPHAREIVLRLASVCDVVIENFSPRVFANWELTYEAFRQVNPAIIMVSISAMGQTGPWKDHVGFGPTLQALAGLSHLTAFQGGPPLGIGYAHADPVTGLYAAMAVLAALEKREETGHGAYIDLSGYEAAAAMLGPALLDASLNGANPPAQGNRSKDAPAAPYGCYRCMGEDRWCVIAVFNDEEWMALRRIMNDPAWAKEAKFNTLPGRKERMDELDLRLGRWTARRTAEEIVDSLQKAGIAAGVVQDIEELCEDPHLRARRFFVPLDHPVLGQVISDASPIRFEEADTSGWKAAPLLGRDNRYVFKKLCGFTEEELNDYIDKGIIA